jgi:hypothetical protein
MTHPFVPKNGMVRELGCFKSARPTKGLYQCKREFNYHNHQSITTNTTIKCKKYASIEEGSNGRAQ